MQRHFAGPMLALALALSQQALAQPAMTTPATTAPAEASQSAPLADLVKAVDIPYESFTLPNGLTVLVNTDRKAPVVGVTTYYRVGSKNEPRGHTGFAHLYEHLFFGGSPNVPNFFRSMANMGAIGVNGSTWYDRTNYVETVPAGALDQALFDESDRMGRLLGSVNQDKLDKQRGVVENEKRQDDNQPYGLVQYAMGDALLPVGHPYRHTTIGSMRDLDAATLTDVRQWFIDHYGPNNAIIALSGDIDVATARPLVEKYFGSIPAGKPVAPVEAGPVTLPAPVHQEMTDQVATTRLMRVWTGPGLTHPDAPALALGMDVLGGLASSRLDNALVRGQQLAVGVSASVEQHEQLSYIAISMDVKPGVERAKAEAAFDAEIARFLKDGPTADELARAATSTVASEIGQLEVVGGNDGKGATLAEGLLYAGDPAHYKKELATYATLTPAQVRAAVNTWLSRPVYALTITPGERSQSGDAQGGWGDEAGSPPPPVDPKAPVPPVNTGAPRTPPPVAPLATLAFPRLEHARLANGVEVTLARRTSVPKVMVGLSFDAGVAADAGAAPGTQGMMLAMLTQGTAARAGRPGLDATALLEAEERLGAAITSGASMDTSSVTLEALTANLSPSLALLADVVRSPAFAPADVDRLRDQRLAALAASNSDPESLALRAINPLIFGPAHPYGQPADGLGSEASLKAMTPGALRAAHARWLRPDLLRITVVGDITMADLLPRLESAFGSWQAPATPRPTKPIEAAVPAPHPRIVLIDRPGSPQSVIVGARVLPVQGRAPGQEVLNIANDVLGGDFLSRLNSDLREDKGWSYGAQSVVRQPLGPRSLIVFAPVQTDRTGASITSLLADMKALPATRPVTPEEVRVVVDGNIRKLPGSFETNDAVLGAVVSNARLGRPDDYYVTLPEKLRSIDAKALDETAARYFQPEGLTFVVVGDRKLVEPQLKGLGLPVEVREDK